MTLDTLACRSTVVGADDVGLVNCMLVSTFGKPACLPSIWHPMILPWMTMSKLLTSVSLIAAMERLVALAEFGPGTPEQLEAEVLKAEIALYLRDAQKALRLNRAGKLN